MASPPFTDRRASDAPPWLRNLYGGLLLAGLITLASAFVKNFESVTDHAADIAALRTDIQRVLDVVCSDKPDARACK